jgi:hypothetical protein
MVEVNIAIALMQTDETVNDGDSALGDDDVSTQTQTIASSIYNYRVENGRYATSLKQDVPQSCSNHLPDIEPTMLFAMAATGAQMTSKQSNTST